MFFGVVLGLAVFLYVFWCCLGLVLFFSMCFFCVLFWDFLRFVLGRIRYQAFQKVI